METLINILVAVQIPANKNYSLSMASISLSADKRFQNKKPPCKIIDVRKIKINTEKNS